MAKPSADNSTLVTTNKWTDAATPPWLWRSHSRSIPPRQAVPTPKGGNLDKHEIDCCSLPLSALRLRSTQPTQTLFTRDDFGAHDLTLLRTQKMTIQVKYFFQTSQASKMAFLLEQELFAPSCLPRQAREHLLKAEAAGAHKYSPQASS